MRAYQISRYPITGGRAKGTAALAAMMDLHLESGALKFEAETTFYWDLWHLKYVKVSANGRLSRSIGNLFKNDMIL